MKWLVGPAVLTMLAVAAATAAAGPEPKAKEVRAVGCVEAGVEANCLVLRDLKSGELFNLLVKEPRPAIGDGIEFTAVPFDGMTYCMQGTAVKVTAWTRKAQVKCTKQAAPGK
jgi:hypothetical protein